MSSTDAASDSITAVWLEGENRWAGCRAIRDRGHPVVDGLRHVHGAIRGDARRDLVDLPRSCRASEGFGVAGARATRRTARASSQGHGQDSN